jgi:hypothetical protein
MRMAVMRYGLPKTVLDGSNGVFYMDNGVDYLLFQKMLWESFRIKAQRAKAYRARSKPVESWHSIMSKRFDPMFGPAYAGKDAGDRSEENTLALRQHKLWREGKAPSTPLPSVSYLIAQLEAWIDEYNEHEHGGHNQFGLSPRLVFDRECPPEQRKPLDIAQLEPLFWQRETRIVRNSKVQIFTAEYEPLDPESDFNLRMYNGREVRVACNPDDLAVALCYEAEGPDHKFIARLRAPQLLAHSPVSRDAVQAMERTNATFRKGLKHHERFLTARAAAVGITTECDSRAARAGIAIPRPMTAQAVILGSSAPKPQLGPAVPSAADAAKHFLALEAPED